MSGPHLARGASKVLANEDVSEGPITEAQRAQTVDAIRAALYARGRERARRRWLVPAAAAAAILVAVGAAWSMRHSSPIAQTAGGAAPAREDAVAAESVHGWVYVTRGGARVPLESSTLVGSGESVSTADGDAVLALTSGSKVAVARDSDVTMVADGGTELVRLDRGTVTSRVAKQKGTQRFIVRTAEAEVEVRGTVFHVSRSIEPGCRERTRVRVDEGRVVVRGSGAEAILDPGGAWVSPCVPATSPSASVAGADPLPLPAPSSIPTTSGPQAAPRAASDMKPFPVATVGAPATELTAQNALFAEAMSAKSRGEPRKAVSSLDTLVERFPRSPLREAAEAQRMSLLVGLDRRRATSAAKDYLARYPRGFARADAEGILRDGP